jgi:hypothetical protein
MERNPYRWLAGRHRKMNRALSGILMGLTALWSVFLCLSFSQALNDFAFAVAILGAFSLHVLIKGWLALEASRRFCEDRQSGAMELLLVTSISEENILRGEFGAIKQSFAFPLIVAFGINVALILSIVVFNPLSLGYERWWFVNAGVMGAIILWLDARALAYTGMLTGLKFTRHHRAVLSALGRVIIPPWGAVVFFFLFILLPGSGLGRRDLLVAMNAWFFLCAALDIALIGHAKWSLRQKLRRICAGEERLGQGFESPECYTDAEEAK